MLEKVVKASGDEIVTGIVRFKKVKLCKGYEEAKKKASRRFSYIKAGRPLANDEYAAVIRFKWWFFLILLLLILLLCAALFFSRDNDTKAMSREEETTVSQIIEPSKEVPTTGADDYENMYICVPGFSDMEWDETEHELIVYNPDVNECLLKYDVYVDGNIVAQSKMLDSGCEELIDFCGYLETGSYKLGITATGYSKDGNEKYNSVYQEVLLSFNG